MELLFLLYELLLSLSLELMLLLYELLLSLRLELMLLLYKLFLSLRLELMLLLYELLLSLCLELMLLLYKLLLGLCFELLSLFSQFLLQLLSKYTLKGFKSSLIDINWLLFWRNGLLASYMRSINRGSTYSSSSGRLNSLRRLRLLCLFYSQIRWWLLCCAIWVILIGCWKLVCLRGLDLLLLLLDDGGLFSRRGSCEVDWLFDIIVYCSFVMMSSRS